MADRLSTAIAGFIAQPNCGGMALESAQRLSQLLRVARYYEMATELATEAAAALREADKATKAETPAMAEFRAQGDALLGAIDPATDNGVADLNAFEAAYQRLKAELLEAGAQDRLGVAAMDAQLRAASALRRAVEQAAKAFLLMSAAAAPKTRKRKSNAESMNGGP